MSEINRSIKFTRKEALQLIKKEGQVRLAYDDNWDKRGTTLYLLEVAGANVKGVILPHFRGFEHCDCDRQFSSDPEEGSIKRMKADIRAIKKEIHSIKELSRINVEVCQ